MADFKDESGEHHPDGGSVTAGLSKLRQPLIANDTSSHPEPVLTSGAYLTKRAPDSDNLDVSGQGSHAAGVSSRRGNQGFNRFK